MSYNKEKRVVVFCDIHHFSSAAKALGDRAVDFIQEVYHRLGEEIVGCGGLIIKYMGDAMLATFPGGCELDAVSSAAAMRRRYDELVLEYGIEISTELEVGIGAGTVAVGIFGHPSLRTADIHGEVVCDSAVIGHHRGIAVTSEVRDAVGDSYEWERLPNVSPRWRDSPIEVWEAVAPKL